MNKPLHNHFIFPVYFQNDSISYIIYHIHTHNTTTLTTTTSHVCVQSDSDLVWIFQYTTGVIFYTFLKYSSQGCSLDREIHESGTWGMRASLLHQRHLWTVWQRCPDPGGGRCPPHPGRVLWWTPHTSAPGWEPYEVQTVARMLPCPRDPFQTL